MENKKLIVSEFVSCGHPDKIADQISDAILDEFLKVDKNVRCGVETLVKDNVVVLGGEIKSTTSIDYDSVVRGIYRDLNFPPNHGLNPDNIKIINLIGKQSPEISKGVDKENGEIGAGDQGFMVGYASKDTPDYLPLGLHMAKKICQGVYGELGEYSIGPDVKTQVITEETLSGEEIVKSILISSMHQSDLPVFKRLVERCLFKNVFRFDDKIFNLHIKPKDFKIDINPNGKWNIGGPVADCGVTGRKIVVDQYGGYANVGGGAFSGKDSSKIDRSAAYAARYIAKNIVAANLASECKVTLSYMIGTPEPCSVDIDTFNTSYISNVEFKKFLFDNIDLTPNGIIKMFKLQEPIFYKTAKFGHFGDEDLPWEKLDLVQSLKNNFPF